ncbi:ribonuclease 2 family protein [Striga asiatica]|uniref:Ribonuclease 2 family protein n=1 Tax=Striga asiatica TaxID=4170 RepID=A0A5A7PB04_STRAF|nr:ribonuclease 2 family protein [Striga asiatica]
MLQSKSFVKKTKQGKVVKVVREHYLRDDIYCGVPFCKVCDVGAARLSSTTSTIIIVDTNVVLHQIDLLENPAMNDVVVLSIVLEEVKNRNLAVYNRLRALCSNPLRSFFVFSNEYHKDTYVKIETGESPNDRNDRAIRVAAQWYQSHVGNAVRVLLITNDRENRIKALKDGISVETVESYVKSLGQPALLDLIVQTPSDVAMEDAEDPRPSKRKTIYSEHKPMSEITSGLHRGIYHQGKLRVNRYNPFEAYVGSESIGDEIIIYGRANMNRAFDGDIVVVELLPIDQWQEEKYLGIMNDEDEEEDDNVHLAPSSADDAPRVSNVKQASSEDKNTLPTRPCGRVIGIIKRNWHSYCGSLDPMPMPAGEGSVAHALFVSKDRRIPKIRIQTRQLGNLLDKRIIVAVDSWDRVSRYPSGHYVRTIGQIGDRDTESEVVLIENDIDARPFSSQVLACLPPLPWVVSAEDIVNPIRQDLRHLRVFSVDPPGCKDIDDALHCTLLPNGHFEVGVHIADVTNFVQPGTPLDDEAAQRGTSVYLVERRIDMLPKPLTEGVLLRFTGLFIFPFESCIEADI